VHWDAKVPRFWRQDFKGLSELGAVDGANIADWPLTYDDLAPMYDAVEDRLGVQGDVKKMPDSTLAQAPRRNQFALAPNPSMVGAERLAAGARKAGYTVYPFPMAVYSRPFNGGGRCNSCGFCSGFGCPILARGDAASSFLHDAMLAGAQLKTRCFVYKVDLGPDGRRAVGVSYIDEHGQKQHARADIVVLAPSAIETARLLLLSATPEHPNGLGNSSDQVGRNVMFHLVTVAAGIFQENLHTWRGPSTTGTIDDFVGPEQGAPAKDAGLPYLKGGICEVGGGQLLRAEAALYTTLPNHWGRQFKDLLRASPLRVHLAGMSMVGEDLPQLDNRVDLDPNIKDFRGYPVARITHSNHRFELAAADFYGAKMAEICKQAPGVLASGWLPVGALANATGGFASPYAGPSSTAHIMGTARMGDDPKTSVVDAWGKVHDLDNLYIADGAVFTSSGGFNPTLTIMALSLRAASRLGGITRSPLAAGRPVATPPKTASTGGRSDHTSSGSSPPTTAIAVGVGGVAVAAAGAAIAVKRSRQHQELDRPDTTAE